FFFQAEDGIRDFHVTGVQTCALPIYADGTADTCVITVDPTPGQPIDFAVMLHDLHYARLRDGYAERNNLVAPGALSFVGFQNGRSEERRVGKEGRSRWGP